MPRTSPTKAKLLATEINKEFPGQNHPRHLVASYLHWTPSISEEAMIHPDQNWHILWVLLFLSCP